MSFPRMDQSTAEEWAIIRAEIEANQPRVADAVLDLLLRLERITDGFSVNQLVHSLQTATLAERAGADAEVVVASLCHDVGKVVSVLNHAEIAAALLKPYVRLDVYELIKAHQDFQGRYYFEHFGGDADARERHRGAPWFDLAERFADEWDQAAFDPAAEHESLKHFEPLVRAVFSGPRPDGQLRLVEPRTAIVAITPSP